MVNVNFHSWESNLELIIALLEQFTTTGSMVATSVLGGAGWQRCFTHVSI
jgi:hypothetical protein